MCSEPYNVTQDRRTGEMRFRRINAMHDDPERSAEETVHFPAPLREQDPTGTADYVELYMPCRSCEQCRNARAAATATLVNDDIEVLQRLNPRLQPVFVTLTLRNEDLQPGGGTRPVDGANFVKRLRLDLDERGFGNEVLLPGGQRTTFAYFGCEEYGSNTGRVHTHLILFAPGLDGDKYPDPINPVSRSGKAQYRSPTFERTWPFGHAVFGYVEPGAATYVSLYNQKSESESSAANSTLWYRTVEDAEQRIEALLEAGALSASEVAELRNLRPPMDDKSRARRQRTRREAREALDREELAKGEYKRQLERLQNQEDRKRAWLRGPARRIESQGFWGFPALNSYKADEMGCTPVLDPKGRIERTQYNSTHGIQAHALERVGTSGELEPNPSQSLARLIGGLMPKDLTSDDFEFGAPGRAAAERGRNDHLSDSEQGQANMQRIRELIQRSREAQEARRIHELEMTGRDPVAQWEHEQEKHAQRKLERKRQRGPVSEQRGGATAEPSLDGFNRVPKELAEAEAGEGAIALRKRRRALSASESLLRKIIAGTELDARFGPLDDVESPLSQLLKTGRWQHIAHARAEKRASAQAAEAA